MKITTSLRNWVEMARPKTLIASISPICIGAALAKNSPYFSFTIFFFILLTGVFLQIATNFANDFFDAKKGADDNRIGPRRGVASGLIKEKSMLVALCICLATATLFSSFLVPIGGYKILLFLLLGILMAIFYTAGPYAFAYLGLGDIVVFFFFGPVATGLTYYLLSSEFAFSAFFAGFGPGAMSTAILVVNNLRDQNSDFWVNKKTLVVRLGKSFGILEYKVCMGIAIATPLLFIHCIHSSHLCILSILFPILALKKGSLLRNDTDASIIGTYLPKTALMLFGYTITFCLCILFV